MSGSVNKVILIGHLGADPEKRQMDSGDASVQVNIATSERWRDKASGDQRERTDWHRLNFYGRIAEIVASYCKKGSQIYVEGNLRTDQYEKDGQTRYITYVRVAQLTLLGGRNSQEGSKGPAQQQSAAAFKSQDSAADSATNGGYSNSSAGKMDDDIPF